MRQTNASGVFRFRCGNRIFNLKCATCPRDLFSAILEKWVHFLRRGAGLFLIVEHLGLNAIDSFLSCAILLSLLFGFRLDWVVNCRLLFVVFGVLRRQVRRKDCHRFLIYRRVLRFGLGLGLLWAKWKRFFCLIGKLLANWLLLLERHDACTLYLGFGNLLVLIQLVSWGFRGESIDILHFSASLG